ncbi:MAG TPA: Gfo/Idh/MocA family oxidoreductase [Bryobacteraceae bacterium]|nr:Gfo/Idh/MocA family oxidoreductase [Bryobacteraceae bacterium]
MRHVSLLLLFALVPAGAEIRLGIVGTDTSHVPAFTAAFNDPADPNHVPGFRVVAAWKGGSPDVEASRTRVDRFAEEIRTKFGVEIVADIPTLCAKVDGVLLESVDGRVHLEQARQIIAARKPMFIDKPLAATLEDAREIARLARQAGVPWFSSSSLRYSEIVTALAAPDATGAFTWGPGPIEEHHPLDLSWYAIHPIEMLYALMGPGCVEVSRISTPDADLITGRWKNGRIGTVRAIRPSSDYGAIVFRPREIRQSKPRMYSGYGPLIKKIAEFFQTGVPPVPNEETLEIFAFMDAAQRSKAAGGRPVPLQ